MIHLDVTQGSPAWVNARIGLPTASNFDRLITPKAGKPSASSTPYLYKLIAEWMLGVSLDETVTAFMQRGIEMEQEAVAYYELTRECDTEQAGFYLRDDRLAGASPDRLVGDDGLLEIKCPAAHTHVGYLLGSVADDYRCQIQGQLYITERAWCDVLSYCPGLPPALVRVERDEDFILLLAAAVDVFVGRLREARIEMRARGYLPKAAA